jgi:hypothetical protein
MNNPKLVAAAAGVLCYGILTAYNAPMDIKWNSTCTSCGHGLVECVHKYIDTAVACWNNGGNGFRTCGQEGQPDCPRPGQIYHEVNDWPSVERENGGANCVPSGSSTAILGYVYHTYIASTQAECYHVVACTWNSAQSKCIVSSGQGWQLLSKKFSADCGACN